MRTLLILFALTFAQPTLAAVSMPPAQAQTTDLYITDDATVNAVIKDGRTNYQASGSKFKVGYIFRLGKRSNPSAQVKVKIVERIVNRTTGNPSFIIVKVN